MAMIIRFIVFALFGIGGLHIAAAQPGLVSLEVLNDVKPLHQVEPVYPATALSDKIEGWVIVSFTVTASGTVAPDSIKVVDCAPCGIFDASAIQAIAQFTFSQRIRNGVAIDVPNVQHVIRYDLGDAEE